MARHFIIAISLCSISSIARGQESTLVLEVADGIRTELVRVAKGTFVQGSPASEPHHASDEAQRQVSLTRDFFIGKYPITRKEFSAFVRSARYRTEAEKGTSGGFSLELGQWLQRPYFTWQTPGFSQADDHPVVLITYPDALEFCKWLGLKTGRIVQLPTEAQWEYACRAGTATAYYNGQSEKDADQIGWFRPKGWESGRLAIGTHPVGQKKPNAWGLHDMVGHVFQWCGDWYQPYPGGIATDPHADRPPPGEKPRRILRGGSWFSDPPRGRSAARYQNDPQSRNANNGLRIVVLAEEALKGAPAPMTGTAPRQQPKPAQRPVQAPTSQPKIDPTPQPYQAPEPVATGNWMLGPLCFGGLCIGAIFLLAFVLRQAISKKNRQESVGSSQSSRVADLHSPRRSTPPPAAPGNIKLVPDGFWIETTNIPSGSLAHLRYQLGDTIQTQKVVITPSPKGQFVYTGAAPTAVEILQIDPPLPDHAEGVPYVEPLPGPSFPSSMPRSVYPPGMGQVYPSERSHSSPPAKEPFDGYPSAY